VLVNLAYDTYGLMDGAYDDYVSSGRDPLNRIKVIGSALIQIISDLDMMLATNVNYLLGVWCSLLTWLLIVHISSPPPVWRLTKVFIGRSELGHGLGTLKRKSSTSSMHAINSLFGVLLVVSLLTGLIVAFTSLLGAR